MPMEFASFDSEAFLRDCWQQQPTVIRNPWRAWVNPLEPDELAGLACENDVESRLVEPADGAFKLEHGPLAPNRFAGLAKRSWTMLVQAVDHHVPAVADLREPFAFLPDWRIDDVMVSYASDGGGVGAHFDQYDVFLIQGLGQRKWQVGGRCDDNSALLPHDGLRLLQDFQPSHEWLLEPGDILYVPARFAHNGIAVGDDCMTYSVGFRAPSRRELIAGWSESVLAELGDDDRYTDPAPLLPESRGQIGPETLARLQGMVAEALLDPAQFARWFGRFVTEPRNAEIDWRPEEAFTGDEVVEYLVHGTVLLRNPAVRFAYIRHSASALDLFVDGDAIPCAGPLADLAVLLCATGRFVPDAAFSSAEGLGLIVDLLNSGALAFAIED